MKELPCRSAIALVRLRITSVLCCVLAVFAIALVCLDGGPASAQSISAFVTVSAASFEQNKPMAPGSIVAGFGPGVAPPGTGIAATDTDPSTPAIELPTLLGDVSVEVNGRSAKLFYVSTNQINYQLPPDLEPGSGTVVVKRGSGQIVSSGQVEVRPVSPTIFTANGTGVGVPAAYLVRVTGAGAVTTEPMLQYVEGTGFIPLPIDLGPEGDRVFLVFFMTGAAGIANASDTRILLGGSEYIPGFVGPAQGFVGLEQANFELPRTLQGRLAMALVAIGHTTSNICEIEIAPPTGLPPNVSGLSKAEVLAGETLDITGTGFTTDAQVLISDSSRRLFNASIVQSTGSKLTVLVPFGAGTGNVVVRTIKGEASYPLKMRTSLSGVVQMNQQQTDGTFKRVGVANATIRVPRAGGALTALTRQDGSFLVADVPPTNPLSSGLIFEVDATSNGVLPFAKETRRMHVVGEGRDNAYPEYIELKPATGTMVPVSRNGAISSGSFAVAAQATPLETARTGQTGQVVFDANGSTAKFPDGSSVNALTVTVLDTGRTPADLPYGHYSSTIVQLTPFGTTLAPGGKLTFPNTDSLPAGSVATLYRFDQTPGSSTLGSFVTAGQAQVSADGQRVETTANAIKESTYYFVSTAHPVTTVYGGVVEEDMTAARGAMVQVRGQSIFALTDQNGAFILPNVPVLGDRALENEVTFLRPDGTVDRAERTGVKVVGGITFVSPPIVLPGKGRSRAPVILAPKSLAADAGKTSDFNFLAYARVAGQTLQNVSVSGAPFSSVVSLGNDRYTLRLAPATGVSGKFTLELSARDSQNLTTTEVVEVEVKASAPSAPQAISQSAVTNEDTPVAIVLTGSNGNAFRIVTPPTNGVISGNAPNLTYMPNQNFNGSDSLAFVVGNGSVESAPAVVSIAVGAVNDAPGLQPGGPYKINIGQRLSAVINGNDVDTGQTLTLVSGTLPAGASISQQTATSWVLEWTPNSTQLGSFNIQLTLRDNGSPTLTAQGAIRIDVEAKWARSPGIDGGLIQSILVAGNTLIAGTDQGGVFRSTDNGASWAPSGLPGEDVQTLVTSGGAIFAGTGRGLFRSNDGGATWETANNGLPRTGSNTPRSILTLRSDDNQLFAGTEVGVYRSENGGANWTASGLTDENVNEIISAGGALYAATDSGVFRSTDGGATWAPRSTGLPVESGINYYPIFAVTSFGNALLAGTIEGVFRSTDSGATWTPSSTGLPVTFNGSFSSVYRLGTGGGALFCGTDNGVYRTTNGTTWSPVGLSDQSIFSITGNDDVVLVGTYSSIFRSVDSGATWSKVTNGLSNLWVYKVVARGNILFTGTDDGVYRSTDNGASWIRSGLANKVVGGLGVSGSSLVAASGGDAYLSRDNGATWTTLTGSLPSAGFRTLVSTGSTLYAATSTGGVFRSTNGGVDWTQLSSGLPKSSESEYRRVEALASVGNSIIAGTARGVFRSADGSNWTESSAGLPKDSNGFYPEVNAFISAGNFLLAATGGQGIYRSADGGVNWTESSSGLHSKFIESLTSSGNTVFAGGAGGVSRSSDAGQNWSPIGLNELLSVFALTVTDKGVFAGTTEGAFVLAEASLAWRESNAGLAYKLINAAAVDGESLVVGTYKGGVFRSTDGTAWSPSSSGLPPASDVRAFVKSGNSLFLGTTGGGVFSSSDQGRTWTARVNGLGNLNVNALTSGGSNIWAGTNGGVFRSGDGGANWSHVNSGLTRSKVLSLAFAANGLFAGTDGGLFRSTNQGTNWTEANGGLGNLYITSLSIAPDGNTVLAGTANGLYLSNNVGQTWTRLSRGISERVVALAFAGGGSKLLAGTVSGFYLSDDNGTSWAVNNTGLLNPQVSAIAVKGDLIVAGTRNAGVFLSTLGQGLSNHAPTLNMDCPATQTVNTGTPVSCQITSSDPDQGQSVTLLAANLPAGAMFNAATGAFSWTPATTQGGNYEFSFTATDTGDPILATSRSIEISVRNPLPSISSLSPPSTSEGGAAFLLTVNGGNFVPNSIVRINGSNRVTNYTSPAELKAVVAASDIASAGNLTVSVFNPAPGGGTSGNLNFVVQGLCTYAIDPVSQSFSAAGGQGAVNVSVKSGCTWNATSNAPSWLTVTAGANGNGNGVVNYTVAANSGDTPRNGTMTIAGKTFTVSQLGVQNSNVIFSIDDGTSEQDLRDQGGTTVGVNRITPTSYPATLTGIQVWIPSSIPVGRAITLLSGSIASSQTNVNTVTLQQTTSSVSLNNNFQMFTVPNLTITSGDFLVGFRMAAPASTEYPIGNDRNSGSKKRSYFSNGGTLTLIDDYGADFAGNFLIRARASVQCNAILTPSSGLFAANGGTGSIAVNLNGGCPWTAVSNANWISITSGSNGAGSGTVGYSVAANGTSSSRSGSITIAGLTFNVTQTAGQAQSIELALDDGTFEQDFGVSGGGTIAVVNRITPAQYPLNLTGVSIHFPSSIPVGKAFTILYGTIASNQSNINSVTLQELNATVQSTNRFSFYSIPNLAVNSGDIVIGFRMVHSPNELPAANDRSSGSKRRSFYSGNGGAFVLIDDYDGFSGNFGIRARVTQ